MRERVLMFNKHNRVWPIPAFCACINRIPNHGQRQDRNISAIIRIFKYIG